MKSAFKIFSYFVFVSTYVLLFILVSLLVISQTEFFRSFVKEQIVTVLNESVNGSVSFNSIEGNLFSRLELNHPTVTDITGDTVIQAAAIKINYMPLFLLAGNLNISSFEIINPSIKFTVDKNGKNNLSGLFKTDSLTSNNNPDSSASKNYVEKITVKSVQIKNGRLLVQIESKKQREYVSATIDYDEQNFNEINLWMSGSHKPGKSIFEIFELTVHEMKSGYRIKQMALKAELTDDRLLDISKLKIQTDSSSFEMTAGLEFGQSLKTDTMFIENLKHAKLTAEVSLAPFNFYDLYAFLPSVNMLKGEVKVDVKASGSLDTLLAERVAVTIGSQTKINASGYLYHLLDGKNLKMNVRLNDSFVADDDVHQFLPYFSIPEFKDAGLLDLNAHYEGTPLNFRYMVDMKSEHGGGLIASGEFNFAKENPQYAVNLKTEHLNLRYWLHNRALDSDLNLTADLNGHSFNYEDLDLTGKINLTASRFQSYQFETVDISIQKKDSLTNLSVLMNTFFAEADLTGSISKQDSLFAFDLKTSARRLNLESISNNMTRTKIDFTSDIKLLLGPGLFTADLDLAMGRFYIGNQQIPVSENIKMTLVSVDSMLNVKLNSGYADFDFKSNKNYEYWQKWIDVSLNNLTFLTDSVKAVDWTDMYGSGIRNYAEWSWKVKNIQPIMAVIKKEDVFVTGSGRGITETQDSLLYADFNIEIDSLTVGKGLTITGVRLDANVDSIGVENYLGYSVGNIKLDVAQVLTGERLWGKLNFETRSRNNKADYKLTMTDPNNLLSFGTAGIIRFLSDSIQIRLKSMDVTSVLADWKLDFESTVSLTKSSFGIDSLRISSGTQSVSMSGELNETGDREMLMLGDKIEISPVINMFNPGFILLPEGQVNLRIFAYGLLSDPSVEMNIGSTPILIKGNDYGQINGVANLADKNFDFSVTLTDKQEYKMAEIKGVIPNQEDSIRINPRYEVALDNFNLSLLRGFIPSVLEIGGVINADLTIEQEAENRKIQGELTISSGFIRLESNNVLYTGIKGKATVRNNTVNISGVDITSPNNGKAVLFGTFELENMIPTRGFNLSLALTDFLVLNKVQSNDSNVYGTVEIQGQLKMRGGLEQSTLNGNLKLKRADIGVISGSANDRTFLNEDSFISFVSGKDTSKTDTLSEKLALFRYRKKDKSFIAGFSAFIQIDASQNTQFSLLLNKATGERLETTAAGNLTLQYQRENLSLTGVMNVLAGRYNFYTAKFVVQNDGFIRWSGKALEPELKLVAKTSLIRQRPSPTNSEETMAENNTLTINIEGAASAPTFTYDILSQLADGQTKSPATSPTLRDNLAANVISLILINQWANDPWLQTSTRNFSGVGTEDLISNTGYNALFGTLSNHLGRYLNSADNRIKYVNLQVQGNRGVTENWGISGGYEINDNWTVIGGFNYGSGNAGQPLTAQTQTAQKDFNLSFRVENKITDNLSWDVFQEYDPYAFDPDLDNQTIYGVSLFYRKRFYYWSELNPFLKEEKDAKSKPADRKSETGAPPNPETEQRTQIQNQ